MSKAVLISIRPKWCEKIVNGEKTVEVRKTRPKMETPFRCYIYYCTLPKYPHEDYITTEHPLPQYYGGGKVIGEFVCDRIDRLVRVGFDGSGEPAKYCICNSDMSVWPMDGICEEACLTHEELEKYLGGYEGYGLHISRVKLYDTPRELSEFTGLRDTRFGAEPYKFKRPPLSWMYVEAVEKEEKV